MVMRSIQSYMPSVVIDLIRKQPMSTAKVAFAWRMAVGPAVERATSTRLREDRTLEVSAEGTHWRPRSVSRRI